VLGPLVIRHETRQGVPTARKPRKVLALLLLNESRVVSVPSLLAELWDDEPPKSALTTLQTYILQLRKMMAKATGRTLAEVAAESLQTSNNGYLFAACGAEFDLYRFYEMERLGGAALADGDLVGASRIFGQALELWTGPTLMDVEQGRLLEAEVARLDQSRLTMLEHRIEADLRLGRHRELLSELAALVAYHRFHEDLHAQFMTALYRSGNRNRAVEVFHRLRNDLIEELGLEPSPKLQRLVRCILDSDPDLDNSQVVPLPRTAQPTDSSRLPAYF
jgi:SARP family transcriptional regulator, regulator of embCAB operon